MNVFLLKKNSISHLSRPLRPTMSPHTAIMEMVAELHDDMMAWMCVGVWFRGNGERVSGSGGCGCICNSGGGGGAAEVVNLQCYYLGQKKRFLYTKISNF